MNVECIPIIEQFVSAEHHIPPSLYPTHRVLTPPPPPLRGVKAGMSKIPPLLPTRIGERYSQTISNLCHAALLRRCEFPL
jgi:hypothetical protein